MPPWLWSPSGGTPGAGRFCAAGSCDGCRLPGLAGSAGTAAASGGVILAESGRGSRFDEWRAERRSAGCLIGASSKKAVGEVFGGEYDDQPTKSGKNNQT